MKTFRFFCLAIFTVFLFVPAISFALEPFSDDFQRANSASVGNDWEEVEDQAISISIENGEVLIKGTQDIDWKRNGIARNVNDISSLSVDFFANDNFNMHIRVDDTNVKGYLEIYCWPGGPFTHANSVDGGWPGWIEIAGSQSVADKYNTLEIKKISAGKLQLSHNGSVVGAVLDNAGIQIINRIYLSADSAKGTTGSLRFDNVVIDGGASSAVNPSSKLATLWSAVRN